MTIHSWIPNRLCSWNHKIIKSYLSLSRPKIVGRYSTPTTGTKCKIIVSHYRLHQDERGQTTERGTSTKGPSVFSWFLYLIFKWRPAEATAIFLSHNSSAKQVDSVLPRVLLRSSLLSDVPPAACTVFWLVVVCIHLMAAHYGKGSTHLSIFIYWLLSSTPQTMVTPHVPPQLHHLPLPSPTLSFGWLSHSFIKWRPPKVEAPPTSLFFDQFCVGAPDKGTSCSGHKPGHRAPEVDSWGATAS